jgi:hypothetical protein
MEMAASFGTSAPAKAGFDAVKQVIDKSYAWLVEVLKDVRTKRDLKSMLNTIRPIVTQSGGVAVARYIGVNPDTAGNNYYEYLGVSVCGTASSASEADLKYADSSVRTGVAKDTGPTIGPAPPLTSMEKQLSDNLLRYYQKNPTNMKMSGGIISLPYFDREIVFIDSSGIREIEK